MARDRSGTLREAAQCFQRNEVEGLKRYSAALRRCAPERPNAILAVGTGVAAFVGEASPMTYGTGWGLSDGLAPSDLLRVEHFFHAHGVPTLIETTSLDRREWFEALADLSCRVHDVTHVLGMPRHEAVSESPPRGDIRVRVVQADERRLWVDTTARAVGEGAEPEPDDVVLFSTLAAMDETACFLAMVNGEPAGGGAVTLGAGVACLFAGGTRPSFRGRGVQAALLRARMDWAWSHDSTDWIRMEAAPGSGSERNGLRVGLHHLFAKLSWTQSMRLTGVTP